MKVISIGIVLFLSSIAQATTISMTGPLTYVGPNAPEGNWIGRAEVDFGTGLLSAEVNFSSDSPSGDFVDIVHWGFLDEEHSKYFYNDTADLELTLVTPEDWNYEVLSDSNFTDLVSKIEINYWDPSYNDSNLTTYAAFRPLQYEVLAVTEPSTIALFTLGLMLCGLMIPRKGKR